MDRAGARPRLVHAARRIRARPDDVAGLFDQRELGALLRQLSRRVPHPVRARRTSREARLLWLSDGALRVWEFAAGNRQARRARVLIAERPSERKRARRSILF